MIDCLKCINSKSKMHDNKLIECKPRQASAGDIYTGFQSFCVNGSSEVPFKVIAIQSFRSIKENCWPFQYEPKLISECEGFSSR